MSSGNDEVDALQSTTTSEVAQLAPETDETDAVDEASSVYHDPMQVRLKTRRERIAKLRRQTRALLLPNEKAVMYLQTLLVWNRPVHLAMLLAVVWVAFYVLGHVARACSSSWQFFGLLGCVYFGSSLALWPVLKIPLRVFASKALTAKDDVSSKDPSHDPIGVDDLHSLRDIVMKRIHLYPFDDCCDRVVLARIEVEGAWNQIKYMRGVSTTRFCVQMFVLCFSGIMFMRLLDGWMTGAILTTLLILFPGYRRRCVKAKVFDMLRPRFGHWITYYEESARGWDYDPDDEVDWSAEKGLKARDDSPDALPDSNEMGDKVIKDRISRHRKDSRV